MKHAEKVKRRARTTGGNLHSRLIKINVAIGVDRYSPTYRQLREVLMYFLKICPRKRRQTCQLIFGHHKGHQSSNLSSTKRKKNECI